MTPPSPLQRVAVGLLVVFASATWPPDPSPSWARYDLLADPGAGHHVDRLIGTGPGRRPVVRLRERDGGWLRMRIERTAGEELGDHSLLLTARELTNEHDAANLLSEQTVLLERIARGAPVSDSLRSVAHLATRRLGEGDLVIGKDGKVKAVMSSKADGLSPVDHVDKSLVVVSAK